MIFRKVSDNFSKLKNDLGVKVTKYTVDKAHGKKCLTSK